MVQRFQAEYSNSRLRIFGVQKQSRVLKLENNFGEENQRNSPRITVNPKLCNIYSATSYTTHIASSYWPLFLRETMNAKPHSPIAKNNTNANSCFFFIAPQGNSNTNQDYCFSGKRTISIGLPTFKTHSRSTYNLSKLILGYATLIPALIFLRMLINIKKSPKGLHSS